MIRALVLLASCLPLPAHAALDVTTLSYICERGAWVPATYINERSDDPDAGSVVVLLIENRQITLWVEKSASGARYGWPSDGSHYVWWTKGDDATLYWHNGEDGKETPILTDCSVSAQTE